MIKMTSHQSKNYQEKDIFVKIYTEDPVFTFSRRSNMWILTYKIKYSIPTQNGIFILSKMTRRKS